MRIGIDARLYNQTGVGRYLRNLMVHLEILDKKNEYYVYLRKEEFSFFSPINPRWIKKPLDIPWHTFQEQIVLPGILLQDNLDIVHFPYFNVPILYPKKFLLTVHDLIIDHYNTGRASSLPHFIYKLKRIGYKLALYYGIKKAARITAISQSTKKEIQEHYHIPSGRITVTYDALDGNFLYQSKHLKPEKLYQFNYILYVGNAYPHKNLEFLLKALQIILNKEKIKLVLAGDDNYFYPRLKSYANSLGISDAVVFFGNANDQDLINLYSYSKLLVFPSLMEGFGLPNLEAVACEKLCVVSDICSFREIWKDNLVFFESNNIEDFVQKILYVLNLKENDYKKKVIQAKKIINQFDWKKTACETLKLYEEIANV